MDAVAKRQRERVQIGQRTLRLGDERCDSNPLLLDQSSSYDPRLFHLKWLKAGLQVGELLPPRRNDVPEAEQLFPQIFDLLCQLLGRRSPALYNFSGSFGVGTLKLEQKGIGFPLFVFP